MDRDTIKYKNIASVVAIIALVLAIPSGVWPYGYYILLRWVVTIVALLVLWTAYNQKQRDWVWRMGAVAIVFNPIIPIYFDKVIWQIIDFFVAIFFVLSIFQIKNDGRK